MESFVKNLKIESAVFGGFEKESVYAAMKKISAMYGEETARLQTENEQLKKKVQAAADQLGQADGEILLLKLQLKEAQRSQSKYEQRFSTLSQAIEGVNAGKEEIIEESKKTAAGIIAEANKKYESINQEYRHRKAQMESVLLEMSDTKRQFGDSIETLRSILAKMLSKIDELQKSGLEQTGNQYKSVCPAQEASESPGKI